MRVVKESKTELPSQTWTQLQHLLKRFEEAWQHGDRPKIDDYLPSDGTRRLFLVELVHAELECRLQRGEPARVEEYCRRYAELADDREGLFGLIAAEYEWRRNHEPGLSLEEYQQRFPQYPMELLASPRKENAAGKTREFSSSEQSVSSGPKINGQRQPEHPTQLGRYRITGTLGQGGFGIVYRGYDDTLERHVAIKVPHRYLASEPGAVEAYMAEARILASLDHPHIVPVYDVGLTDDGLCFVVSKWIQGSDLKQKIKDRAFSFAEAARLVHSVALALHHAHGRGLVHRDIKPGNILLDAMGEPYVADFGLALREEDFGKGSSFAGTPAYMSPEQARGEGHRVDGRSDIFSLSVVFYELLTGRRPFRGDTWEQLLDQIMSVEVRPPRQMDERIPKELERICLKGLAKRASERYTIAKDLAEDLQHFLEHAAESEKLAIRAADAEPASSPLGRGLQTTPQPATPTPTAPVKIVPKGLRSFDAHDADFFLQLLPGPRDREGLPESIRFWKSRIEETDSDKTFAVGLVYGPSGCGKSSLVKAGLLPRLAAHVVAVYVEATAAETESRLLKTLRKHCPDLPPEQNLVETIAAIRRGRGLASGKKLLIILDQFEQWLHTKRGEQSTELVQALRQCDGERVQCLVMVRDDFWMAATRFMQALEIRLVEAENSCAVDLFDPLHARKVLAAFGQAYGRLPDNLGKCTKDENTFLDHAVAGLAQDSKVISIRLALFAEMVKGKPWTPATLREIGGTEGVGITFLEETFAAAAAPPPHRLHQKAAQAVLKLLLPEAGTDIKGHMRSQHELLEASGYASRPRDFEELLRVLDSELRLITPTEPEGVEGGGWRVAGEECLSEGDKRDGVTQASSPSTLHPPPSTRYYQLTHDYLVPSLREWLTRKQKETRQGRAELRLAGLAAQWTAFPAKRQLPRWWEWLNILCFTRQRDWTTSQRQMMQQGTRHHLLRGLTTAAVLLLLGLIAWQGYARFYARTLVDRLGEATTAGVPGIVEEMASYRRWVDPLLREASAQAFRDNDRRRQLNTSLALLPVDSGQVEFLYGRLLEADVQDVMIIRAALQPFQTDMSGRLWSLLGDPKADLDRRFRAACALADYAPDDPRWEKVGSDVAARLVIQNSLVLSQWAEALRPVGRFLLPALASFLENENPSGAERTVIATLYQTYAREQPDAFAPLERLLVQAAKADASLEAKVRLWKRQANAGAALLVMGHGEKVWPLLKHSPAPDLRTFLIDRLAPGGVEPKVLWAAFDKEPDVSIKRAILLSLGGFGLERLPLSARQNETPRLLTIYRDDPDPGLHSSAEWLLRQWQADARLRDFDQQLATGKVEGKRQWYLNRQGQLMVLLPRPGEFWMGQGAERHKERTNRSFAIAAKEVTVEQFRRFRNGNRFNDFAQAVNAYAPTGDCPMIFVSWYDAVAYCNWLSEQDGLPRDQWCYEPDEAGRYHSYPERMGYRLPSEAEWEYACRAGAQTSFSCGESDDLLAKYAWYGNKRKSQSAGRLRPNDFGLFDMHGNAWEWCQDKDQHESRVLRGGTYVHEAMGMTCGYRDEMDPGHRDPKVGIRPARTIAP